MRTLTQQRMASSLKKQNNDIKNVSLNILCGDEGV